MSQLLDVEVVDVLLDDVVAAEPVEVVPVAHLVFHFGLLRLARLATHRPRAVPVDARADDVADRAVVELLDGFDVPRVVVPLQADADHQVLLLGFFVGGQDAAHAGASTATGFSMKMCLPAFTAASKCMRAEAGRRGEDHEVDAAVDHLLVGVEADELPLLRARRPCCR